MREHLRLVLVFLFGLLLKTSSVVGAETVTVIQAPPGEIIQQVQPVQTAPQVVQAPIQVQQVQTIPAPTISQTATVQNNGVMIRTAPAPQVAYAPNDDLSTVFAAKKTQTLESENAMTLTPMLGGGWYHGNWNWHISNIYSLGMALEIPSSQMFSWEIEGQFNQYNISYYDVYHSFNQYSAGANAKIYLSKTAFRPYVGGGLSAILYENMSYGYGHPGSYNQWIGAASVMAGAELKVSDNMAIGARGQWVRPIYNRPPTSSDGYTSAPGYEETAAINTSYYRLLGTVSFTL